MHVDVVELISCDKCKSQFKSLTELEKHIQSLHEEGSKTFACRHCKSDFDSKDKLAEHMQLHIKVKGNTVTSIKCNKCEKSYDTMSKVRRHDWRNHRAV